MAHIPSIFQISAEQQALNEALFEAEGELTPELEAALVINEANLAIKTESYCSSIQKFDSMIEAANNEIKRLQGIVKRSKNASERMKNALSMAMQTFGYDRYEIGTHKLSFRKSEGVVIEDEQAIPPCYIIVETKVDKAKLKADLKEGVIVSGAFLEQRKNIQIK